MLIFNEGLPRAGKTYDAVANHILPALKAGRHVYARLNGLKPYAIAQTAGIPEDQVRELLHLVEPNEVLDLFRVTELPDKTKVLNPKLKRDALFVIDEVHEFYMASRVEADKEVEQFFAYHGQFGMDGVLISQWYKRVHDAIRGRVERKHLFRKLNFMKSLKRAKRNALPQYVCRQQIAMEPDKFAVLCSNTHTYDPAIWQCYSSYQGGAQNVEAYDPGFAGIFSGRQKWVLGFCLLLVALGGLRLVTGYASARDQAELDAATEAVYEGEPVPVAAKPPEDGRIAAVATGAPLGSAAVTSPAGKHDAAVGYFFNLAKTGRTRLAAVVGGDNPFALIEWRVGNGNVLDRVDSRDLEAMGFTVTLNGKWATLEANGETIMATMWPLDSPYSPPKLNSERAADRSTRPVVGASSGRPQPEQGESAPSAGPVIRGAQVSHYGQIGVELNPGA